MGVYINGMEMPKDGAFVEVLIWSDGHVTQTGNSYFAEDGRAYYQPCDWKYFSAVPVPPHGDLIDYNFCLKNYELLHDDDGNPVYAVRMRDINAVPAIIEAEEVEG